MRDCFEYLLLMTGEFVLLKLFGSLVLIEIRLNFFRKAFQKQNPFKSVLKI